LPGDGGNAGSGASRGRLRSIDNCGRTITFDKAPSKVVILNGTSVGEVESFVLLGLQDRILAAPDGLRGTAHVPVTTTSTPSGTDHQRDRGVTRLHRLG
jgi:hypothetical protein